MRYRSCCLSFQQMSCHDDGAVVCHNLQEEALHIFLEIRVDSIKGLVEKIEAAFPAQTQNHAEPFLVSPGKAAEPCPAVDLRLLQQHQGAFPIKVGIKIPIEACTVVRGHTFVKVTP